ncbi:LysR family transcriptional regulator [Paraburkholderia sp. GAS199]|uniref:LysR family transcriptional regulator n=1 Tax=Paraburkholderia sp. GAS199 TaxID=3035126 RepID=UPI003D1B5E73
MINNIQLRYFMGVANVGSIRKAAEQLFVAASAISRQVRLLEEEVGAPLFERHPGQKSLKLTAAGELMLQYARMVDHEWDELRTQIQAVNLLQRGTVRLGVSEAFTRAFLPAFIKNFRDQYPGISFHVVTYGALRLSEMLIQDALDAMLVYGGPDSFDLSIVKEIFVKQRLLISATHPLASKKTLTLSDCGDLDFAFPDETMGNRAVYVRMFAQSQIKPRLALVTNSYELTRSVAQTGVCVAIVSDNSSAPPGMKYVPLTGPGIEPWPMRLCVHRGRTLAPAVRLCVEQLSEAMSSWTAFVKAE